MKFYKLVDGGRDICEANPDAEDAYPIDADAIPPVPAAGKILVPAGWKVDATSQKICRDWEEQDAPAVDIYAPKCSTKSLHKWAEQVAKKLNIMVESDDESDSVP